uniref:Uncharacterized protein n=1 Tax=Aegilops tauschii subsp. strangulata TaxID=200361 RepID=A0A452XYI4_AEGTS
ATERRRVCQGQIRGQRSESTVPSRRRSLCRCNHCSGAAAPASLPCRKSTPSAQQSCRSTPPNTVRTLAQAATFLHTSPRRGLPSAPATRPARARRALRGNAWPPVVATRAAPRPSAAAAYPRRAPDPRAGLAIPRVRPRPRLTIRAPRCSWIWPKPTKFGRPRHHSIIGEVSEAAARAVAGPTMRTAPDASGSSAPSCDPRGRAPSDGEDPAAASSTRALPGDGPRRRRGGGTGGGRCLTAGGGLPPV